MWTFGTNWSLGKAKVPSRDFDNLSGPFVSLCRIHFDVLSHLSLKPVENKINVDRI